MIARVFPRCGMLSQAIAFNLFLAFFPALLIMVGFATSRIGGRTSLLDLITDLTAFLPPGSQSIVSEFLEKRGPEAWKFALVGWGGTLLAGSQVMRLLMEGIHRIYGDQEQPGFLHRQLRGLVLLLVTIAPLAGGGNSGSSWTADPTLAWGGIGPAPYPAGMVDSFLSGDGDFAGDVGADGHLSGGSARGGTNAARFAGRDGGDIPVVAGERAIWVLCASRAVQRGVRRTCGGDRIDGVDAAVRGDHISGCGLERRIG